MLMAHIPAMEQVLPAAMLWTGNTCGHDRCLRFDAA
jgi:hypothetical protein